MISLRPTHVWHKIRIACPCVYIIQGLECWTYFYVGLKLLPPVEYTILCADFKLLKDNFKLSFRPTGTS